MNLENSLKSTHPFAGSSDGRILLLEPLLNTFRDFAVVSPNRTKAFCDGKVSLNNPTCGLPTGLSPNLLTGKLYTCDTFYGLADVGPRGGLGTIIVPTTITGVPYLFLVGVDVATDDNVYFTDASTKYPAKDFETAILNGDQTGRVLKYDQIFKNVTVLLTQLATPLGVATDSEVKFLLVSVFGAKRIRRYWLKGEKAGTSEIFITFQGNPNKIKRNQDGDFWVAVKIPKNDTTVDPQAVKISPSGEILTTIDLSKDYNQRITVVEEQGGNLYVAGVNITFVGRYRILYN